MIRLPPIADCRLQIAAAVEASALGTGSELIVLVFEQDVERGERSAGRCVNRNSWIVNRCA